MELSVDVDSIFTFYVSFKALGSEYGDLNITTQRKEATLPDLFPPKMKTRCVHNLRSHCHQRQQTVNLELRLAGQHV